MNAIQESKVWQFVIMVAIATAVAVGAVVGVDSAPAIQTDILAGGDDWAG